MSTGFFLVTSNADIAEKLKKNGYQLVSNRGGFFTFIDNPEIKFNFEDLGICRTNKLTF